MTKLQELRKEKKITQEEFSRLSKISVRSIQDLEQGRVSIDNVHLSTLIKFGQVLDVPFVVLLEDEKFARDVRQQCEAVRSLGPGPAQQEGLRP